MNSIGKKYVDGFSSALKNASRPIPTEAAMRIEHYVLDARELAGSD